MNKEIRLGDCTIYKHFDHLIENDLVVSKNYKYKKDERKKSTYDYWTLNEDNPVVRALIELEKTLENRSNGESKKKRLIRELSELDKEDLRDIISKTIKKKS